MVLEFGADINKPATANQKRITALILAASMGNLNMVKYLIDEGAKIEKEGKSFVLNISYNIFPLPVLAE